MTDYWLGDREELTPEQKKKSEAKLALIRKAAIFAEPLLREITTFVNEAKNGKASKKRRYDLLKKIEEYGVLCRQVGGEFQCHDLNVYKKTVEILGAYEYARLVREGK